MHAWYTPIRLILMTHLFLCTCNWHEVHMYLPQCFLLFVSLNSFWIASCHFLHDLRLGQFLDSLNVWGSSLVGLVTLAIMKNVSIKEKFRLSIVCFSWATSSTIFLASLLYEACNFLMLVPLLNWQWCCGSVHLYHQHHYQNCFLYLCFQSC